MSNPVIDQNPARTDRRFEAIIAGKDPVIDQKKPGKEELRIRTFVVTTVVALVSFPSGMAFRHFPKNDETGTPEYHHAQVGGTHVHLTEGLTPDQLTGPVTAEIRIRHAEPTADRKGRTRNYEMVVRLSPTTETAQKRVVIQIHSNPDVTLLPAATLMGTSLVLLPNESEENSNVSMIHKGGKIRICDINAPQQRRDSVHAPERTDRERGGNHGDRNKAFRW